MKHLQQNKRNIVHVLVTVSCIKDLAHNHIESDAFTSFLFESQEPFQLHKFQEFLYALDDSLIRMKGKILQHLCASIYDLVIFHKLWTTSFKQSGLIYWSNNFRKREHLNLI